MNGRLSIKDDDPTKIIAASIKEIINEDEKYNKINVNITEFSENRKESLRKSIRHYSKLENASTDIEVTINGEVRSCGKIYMDSDVEKEFYRLYGKENIYIS